jgi:ABC-type polysaccharide/polyol phosphate export permease
MRTRRVVTSTEGKTDMQHQELRPADSRVERPPSQLRFRRRVRVISTLRELWQARSLIRALVERQLRARYKQALLGFAWAIIPPVVLTIGLSLFVERVVDVPTGGVPYPLFAYVGLLPWTFFSSSLTQASGSLLGSQDLLNKVHFPREVFPLASVVTAAIDSLVALAGLGVLFVVYNFPPKATTLWIPVLFAVQAAFTIGVAMLMSALVVYVRDLRHALPIVIQFGLFATPIAYGIQQIPASVRTLYSALNPLAPVIDGYRRTVLYGQPPDWTLLLPGAITAFSLLAIAFVTFKRLETGFADVA